MQHRFLTFQGSTRARQSWEHASNSLKLCLIAVAIRNQRPFTTHHVRHVSLPRHRSSSHHLCEHRTGTRRRPTRVWRCFHGSAKVRARLHGRARALRGRRSLRRRRRGGGGSGSARTSSGVRGAVHSAAVAREHRLELAQVAAGPARRRRTHEGGDDGASSRRVSRRRAIHIFSP